MSAPHGGQPVVSSGMPLGEGRATVIMVHGRGASPASILTLVPRFDRSDLTYLAPTAAGGTWYPQSFLAEIAANEPFLSSALDALGDVVTRAEAAGVPRSRIVFAGFSQGACLSSEFIVRHPGRWGGLVAFSGGLIGPPGTTWSGAAAFDGTPMFFGCSDVDSHVPKARVEESAATFTRLQARVTLRLYPGMGHVINDDEIEHACTMLDGVR